MAVPIESSLSQVCRALADFVLQKLNHDPDFPDDSDHLMNTIENVDSVLLGNPESAKPDGDAKQKVNMFFYHFSPFEFNADVLPGETVMWRTYCLITPFAADEDGKTAGENDLRLLGEVIRVFHETPVQIVKFKDTADDEVSVHVQAVFKPLNIEEMNQIWSTQGNDIAYRPSVAYEFALAPVIPRKKAEEALLVGATGFRVDGNMDHAEDVLAGEDYSAIVQTPVVAAISVNSEREGWVPAACFIYASGCAQSLIFGVKDGEAFPKVIKNKDTGVIETTGDKVDALQIWIAGKIDQMVSLRWEVWNSTDGWQAPVDASVPSFSIKSEMIDPDHVPVIPDASVVSIDLPINTAGQAVLYAEYSYLPMNYTPDKRITSEVDRIKHAERAMLTVRSNPLMLTIYELSP